MTKIANGAKRTYNKGTQLAGRAVNRVMKPGTKMLTSVTKKVPLVGRSLTRLATMPRRFTRGATSIMMVLPQAVGRIPRAVGRIGSTGFDVTKHTILDIPRAMRLFPNEKPTKKSSGKKSSGKKSSGKK